MSSNKPTFKKVFFNGNFFSLWLGQIAAQFGERLTQMALVGLIYQQQEVSAHEMSKLLFFMILPVFIFNPIAGVFVDRRDRKLTMIGSDLARALLLCFIPITYKVCNISATQNLYPIYFIVFLIFTAARFFMPAKSALIPEIMDKESLRMANSISSTSKMIATVLGLLFGSIIVKLFGAASCFYINSSTFILSAISICFVKRKYITEVINKESDRNIITKLKEVKSHIIEGIFEIKKNAHVYFIVKVMCAIMAAGGAIFVIFPVFVNKHFGAQVDALGVLVSCLGAGLFLGAVLLGKYVHSSNNKKILSASVVLVGMLFIVLANLSNIYAAYVCMFVIGIFGIPLIVCTETLIQEMVHDKMIGRVYSSVEIIIHAAFLASMWITGLLGDIASPGFVLSILGIAFAGIMIVLIAHEKAKNA